MLGDGNEGISTIPGFNQIQFEGFCRFIDQGLTEELYKFPKIEDTDQEIEFQLFVETYQLVEPLINERDDVYESLTYSSELYVSARLIWKNSRDMQEQTIFIGNIPLMNSLGTSIVNGIYRIVINQILQSPGIYYRSELDHNGISVYTGTIISDWGGRSELEIDRKARIWAHVSRKQKISILVLSSAIGLNLREILENVCYLDIFLSFLNDKERKKIGSKENSILEFYQQLACVGGDPVFSESLCKVLQKKFFQQRCERIFGPIKREICACGNYRVIGDEKEDPTFCEQCGVKFVDSRIRRYQMGYIKLACLVTHVWYLKRHPSYIANLLDTF